MRLATWNMKGAGSEHSAWDYFLSSEMVPDIALLQEVGLSGPPLRVLDDWEMVSAGPVTKGGSPQRFLTMILVRKDLHPSGLHDHQQIAHSSPWLNDLLVHFEGNLLRRSISIPSFGILNLVSVYSPAWSVESTGLHIGDSPNFKLELSDSRWVTDLLLAGLKELFADDPTQSWVVAGDLNLSVTFDARRMGGRGNAEYLQKMRELGLVEVLAASNEDRLMPTFRHSTGSEIHQMDHLFLSANLTDGLKRCWVGDRDVIFQPNRPLSDHLPVMAIIGNAEGPTNRS